MTTDVATYETAEASLLCEKILTNDTINPNVKAINFGVVGLIFIRQAEIARELAKGEKKPFKRLVLANFGDCHATGQKPLTFVRQVLTLCTYPALLDSSEFPEDAKKRARRLLAACRGQSQGAYTDTPGLTVVRKDVADFISKRDGIKGDYNDVILCSGVTDGVRSVMKLLMTGKDDLKAGIMIPFPQYPLYTAAASEYNGCAIPYYLDESNNWRVDISELQTAIDEARNHCVPRALVVINPGNPTSQVLSRENMEDIIKFAKKERLFILADEVYQQNIHAKGCEFQSFKKVLTEMGGDYATMEIASFLSTSKGYMGECGCRGGYIDITNVDPAVKVELIKSNSSETCPNVTGQITVDLLVNPPQEGEPSYELFEQEKKQIMEGLALKAKMATESLNEIEGIQCSEIVGSMYAFPRIFLPEKAIDEARVNGLPPDELYCLQLLEETGICVLPGYVFGQKDGTYHFRMAIMMAVEDLKYALESIKKFHAKFTATYS